MERVPIKGYYQRESYIRVKEEVPSKPIVKKDRTTDASSGAVPSPIPAFLPYQYGILSDDENNSDDGFPNSTCYPSSSDSSCDSSVTSSSASSPSPVVSSSSTVYEEDYETLDQEIFLFFCESQW
jgi:hypothetical protein